MNSEEKSIQAISAQAHSEAADNRLLRKKLQARDKRVVELEAREQKLKETYANELEKLTSDFNARLAAKQNEINQLKGINDGDNPTTTMPGNSNPDSTMSPEAKLKASEQQKANLQIEGFFGR